MLKFAPILIALIYGYTMYRFSAWRTKSNLDQNSRLLDDKPLRYLTDKMAKSLDLSEICNTSYQFRLGLMYFGDKFKMFSITVYVEI